MVTLGTMSLRFRLLLSLIQHFVGVCGVLPLSCTWSRCLSIKCGKWNDAGRVASTRFLWQWLSAARRLFLISDSLARWNRTSPIRNCASHLASGSRWLHDTRASAWSLALRGLVAMSPVLTKRSCRSAAPPGESVAPTSIFG